MPKLKRLGEAVWFGMRDEYVTGNESYASIAARYGIPKGLVEQHSCDRSANNGRTWSEMRREFHDDILEESKASVIDAVSKTMARVKSKAAKVAELALDRLTQKLESEEPMEDKDIVAIAKLATAVKVELAGDPDQPVNIKANLDALTVEQLRKLASG